MKKTLYSIIFIYKKDNTILDFDKNKEGYILKVYLIIILAIGIFFGINTGSPGPRSLLLNAMIGQNLSMIFIFPAICLKINYT